MKKPLALLLSVLMLLAVAAGCGTADEKNRLEKIKEAGKIVMVTSPDYAPSEFIDPSKTGQDQYVGADIALGYYIAEQLGVKLEIQAMDFNSVLAAVTTGNADMAISGLAWKEDRAENMGLSNFYNWESGFDGHSVIVSTDKAAEMTKPEDFSGMTLAVQAGSLQQSLAEAQLPSDVKFQMINNLADAIMMLKTGKVDGVVSSRGSGDMLIKDEAGFAFTEFHFDYDLDGTVIGVPKNEPELLAEINKILAKAIESDLLAGWYAEAKALAESLNIE